MNPENGASPAAPTDEDSSAEPCPTPLAWHEVANEFHEESDPWKINRDGFEIQGATIGSGPPLYFLNGMAGSYDLFALTVWLLRDDFRCTVFNYRKPLLNHKRRRSVSIRDYSDDLIAIADYHNDTRVSLFATSFGSVVALDAMLNHAQRIDRVAIQGGFAHLPLTIWERIAARCSRIMPGALHQVPIRQSVQSLNHRMWFPPFDETRWQFFLDDTGATSISALASRAGILSRLDLRPKLDSIQHRVLLIESEGEGRITSKCHKELKTNLRNTSCEFLHTTGHLPYLSHPHRLTKLLKDFLADSPTDRGVDPSNPKDKTQ